MNSIAVFFVADLDDMMISGFDEDTLKERTVQAFLTIMKHQSMVGEEQAFRKQGQKLNSGSRVHELQLLLRLETHMIRFIAWVSIIVLLPLTIYTFFEDINHENSES
eukprot:CAMPEP_0113936928 /NCGR_PEP_ID=MMETSP1339-20121228/3672_1 /TAXON_ID=94617 /ORGANISM="Fibrocapsa japonica" /LENGTH=106 /DNA_ID=CAMNT_0000939513 /DNA_START=71 /DNA_END=391 /DNA_ORIENTATION=- /assembly_acc=CAM_ASM_000762